MRYEDILIEPVVSEKASALREQNKYVFIVHPDATKTEIKEAVLLHSDAEITCTRKDNGILLSGFPETAPDSLCSIVKLIKKKG